MATTKVLINGHNKYSANITGIFSVADESDVVVIDRSTLVGPDGVNPPNKIRIDEITYSVGPGFDYVLLEWDDGTDEVIEYMQGAGFFDYRPVGGKSMAADPATAAEGDILLTTAGGAANDTYSILVRCTLLD